MIDIIYRYDDSDKLTAVEVLGHSYGEGKGKDIYCAAVSFMTQFMEFVLLRNKVLFDLKKTDGEFVLKLKGALSSDQRYLFDEVKEYMLEFAREYPQKVSFKEVRKNGTQEGRW